MPALLLSPFRRPFAWVAICLSLLAVQAFAAPAFIDFGNVAVGATNTRQGVVVVFRKAGTVGSINAVLGGVAGLDYTSSNGSCSQGSVYQAGQFCTVDVSFTPQFPGARNGAIVIANAAGVTLATTYLTGVGQGPLATFPAATPNFLTNALPDGALGIGNGNPFYAIDGKGRVYYAATSDLNAIYVEQTNGNLSLFAQIPSHSGSSPVVQTFDGAGNLILSTGRSNPKVIRVDPSGRTSLVATIKPQPPSNTPIYVDSILALGNGDLLTGSSIKPGAPGYSLLIHPDGTYQVQAGPTDPNAQTDVSALAISSSGTVYGVSYGWVYQNNQLLFKNSSVFGVAVDASGTLLAGSQVGYLGATNQPCPIPTIPGGCNAVPAPPVNQVPFLFPILDARGDVYVSYFFDPSSALYKIKRTQAPAVSFASPGTATSYGSFAITNSGNQPLDLSNLQPTLAGAYPQAFNIEKTSCGQSLAPAATCSISLSYTPSGEFPNLPTSASLLLNGLAPTRTVVPLLGFPNQ